MGWVKEMENKLPIDEAKSHMVDLLKHGTLDAF